MRSPGKSLRVAVGGRTQGCSGQGRGRGKRGKRRGKWQWRARIESVMGALGCFWAVMSGVAAVLSACEERCLLQRAGDGKVRGRAARAALYPTCGHGDGRARRGGGWWTGSSSSDGAAALRAAARTTAQKVALRGSLVPFGASATESSCTAKQQPSPPKHLQPLWPRPLLSPINDTLSPPWPISPTSPSCSRPAWTPGATRKVSTFSVYCAQCGIHLAPVVPAWPFPGTRLAFLAHKALWSSSLQSSTPISLYSLLLRAV